ncbi:MAG: hypothetical protein NTY04_03280 [Candidatus Staskawiczbacteria bacterium]|nr:hypothetical protein [Candidatus Staskawiczbacteria bacterium]
MTLSIVHSREEGLQRLKEGAEIIVLADRLFGFHIVATTDEAMLIINSIAIPDTVAELAEISSFFIPYLTLQELLELIKKAPETKKFKDSKRAFELAKRDGSSL